MAFPTIPTAAANTLLFSETGTASTTHTFPSLTTLDNASGNLLIAIIVQYNASSTTNTAFSSWGASFTEFGDSATATTAIISKLLEQRQDSYLINGKRYSYDRVSEDAQTRGRIHQSELDRLEAKKNNLKVLEETAGLLENQVRLAQSKQQEFGSAISKMRAKDAHLEAKKELAALSGGAVMKGVEKKLCEDRWVAAGAGKKAGEERAHAGRRSRASWTVDPD